MVWPKIDTQPCLVQMLNLKNEQNETFLTQPLQVMFQRQSLEEPVQISVTQVRGPLLKSQVNRGHCTSPVRTIKDVINLRIPTRGMSGHRGKVHGTLTQTGTGVYLQEHVWGKRLPFRVISTGSSVFAHVFVFACVCVCVCTCTRTRLVAILACKTQSRQMKTDIRR